MHTFVLSVRVHSKQTRTHAHTRTHTQYIYMYIMYYSVPGPMKAYIPLSLISVILAMASHLALLAKIKNITSLVHNV